MIKKTPRYLTVCCLALAAAAVGADPDRDPQVQILQPGVRLSLIATHPDLVTPTGIDVDENGDVWLVASHTHFPPDDYVGPEHDEILVFGSNGQRRVFYNATHHTMDLELGTDGWVYLAERDRILRVKDTDGDGQGDVEESLAVLATEADYPHNGLSGLAWHPAGDLIFGLGENYSQSWTLTGRDGAIVKGFGEGGIFRCSSDAAGLRRIARGLWNPFGVCVRDNGEIFAADNDPGERPPCRLLHIVEGGDYGFQRLYGSEAHHPFVCWNGELRGTLPMIHPSGEAPCGVTPLGRGVIVPSWSDHRINFFRLQQKGASYSAERIELVRGERYFRPTCIARDQSGSDVDTMTWYLADWVDGRYQVHGFGRLWKLEINLKQATWVGPADIEPPTKAAQLAAEMRTGQHHSKRSELLGLAGNEDPFLARAALLALARQAHSWKPDDLQKLSTLDRIQAVLALKLATDTNFVIAKAPVASEEWVRVFLAGEDPELQFEVLRWIADAQLKEFLPAVEQLLGRSDLDFRLFEAAIATWNTLSGQPEAGVRNTERLLSRVRDPASAPRLRAFALRLLPTQPRVASDTDAVPFMAFPKGLTVELLRELLDLGDPALSLEGVRTLAGNPTLGQRVLAELAGDSNQAADLRAEAIAGLAAVSEAHLDLLIRLADDEIPMIGDEALRSLRSSVLSADQIRQIRKLATTHPETADLARAVIDPKTLTTGRPAFDDTAGWLQRMRAVPGPPDTDSGRRIFHHSRIASCSRCHRHNGRGSVVGPDLSAVSARHDRKWLLESLLQPSRDMAPEYRPTMILLRNGRTITGIRLRSSTREALRDNHGQNQTFDRSDIEAIRELNQSFMPDGLVHSLTDCELRDLIAFLESRARR